MPRTRLTPMATDGQGVILAVPHTADTRLRTTMDLLARRVSHRLGCPVAMAQIQRDAPLLDAPVEQLSAKGVQQIVVVPVESYPVYIDGFDAEGLRRVSVRGDRSVTLRLAQGLGGDPLLVDAVLEALEASERTPSTETAVLIGIPEMAERVIPSLAQRSRAVTEAGWAGVGFVRVPGQVAQFEQELERTVPINGETAAVFVALTVNPGAFASRCEDLVSQTPSPYQDKIEVVSTTLHATPTISNLIRARVVQARRQAT